MILAQNELQSREEVDETAIVADCLKHAVSAPRFEMRSRDGQIEARGPALIRGISI
jgi:hypothetical protein